MTKNNGITIGKKGRTHKVSRRHSREHAVRALYGIQFNDQIQQQLPAYLKRYQEEVYKKLFQDDYALELIQGVIANLTEIDQLVDNATKHRDLGEFTPVDLTIIRVSVYEFHIEKLIDVRISINEAVEIGKHYSTEKSGSFINGVLDAIYHYQ